MNEKIIREVLSGLLLDEKIRIEIPNFLALSQTVNHSSLLLLEEISAILRDTSLSDFDCVDKIVLILEYYGFSCGVRHDFG